VFGGGFGPIHSHIKFQPQQNFNWGGNAQTNRHYQPQTHPGLSATPLKRGLLTYLCSHRLYLLSISILLSFLSAPLLSQPSNPNPAQRDTALIRVAGFKHLGFQVVAARLKLGVDTALAWRQLDTLLEKPTGDIFWMYPATGFYFNMKDKLSDDWKRRFRQTWKSYTPYRGDTENHFLMYYSSLFLFSQEWPDLPGSEWFNGKSSKENYAEAKEYLNYWIDETVRYGTTEWDSPRYLYYYLTPLIILRDFTADPVMQRRFDMMLEYQLADFAAEYLNGSYCGAHSRDGDGSVIDPRKAEATTYAQFYFEDSLAFVLPDLAYAAMSNFHCPRIIRDIAHDRDTAFVHTEVKRSRAKMRFSPERYTPVYKYDYMTPDYCLGSMQGGLQQPIQQHTWDITFASDKPNNTIFGLHPYYSGTELGMFFPEEPELMIEGITKAKASYTNENKWIGGSPYEHVSQYQNVLHAFYEIDSTVQPGHADLFIPKSIDTLVRGRRQWIFVSMGDAFAGIYFSPPQAVVWTEEKTHWRIRLTSFVTLWVECASTSNMSFDEFQKRLEASWTDQIFHSTLSGDTLGRCLPDPNTGKYCEGLFRYENRYPSRLQSSDDLFNGPHLQSAYDSAILELRCNGRRRVLDFKRNEVREE
jgi:hypothetical protein